MEYGYALSSEEHPPDDLVQNARRAAPDEELVQKFEQAGGKGKPRYGQLTICWAESEEEAKHTAHEVWPNAGLEGPLSQELAVPEHFEAADELVTPDKVAETVVCGPDADLHVQKLREYEQAGYDHVYVHQVGRDQEGFFRFYEREVLPKL